MDEISIQTITLLTEAITGGPGGGLPSPRFGKYRSGPELEMFLGSVGIEFAIGDRSRVPSVLEVVHEINRDPQRRPLLVKLIEAACDIRNFKADPVSYPPPEPNIPRIPKKLRQLVDELNTCLRIDGYELRSATDRFRLRAVATDTSVTKALRNHAKQLDLESVQRDFDRALSEANENPEGAITAACSTIESVCKCIIDDLGLEYPSKRDIKGLYGVVSKQLQLAPGQADLPDGISQDIKQILGGLQSVVVRSWLTVVTIELRT